MRKLRLVHIFIFFLLLGGWVLLFSSVANADCCMCGWGCYDGCDCPGLGGCPWCATPDSENLRLKALSAEATPNINSVNTPVPSMPVNASSVDRLIRRIGTGIKIGQCAQNNFRLKITDGENSLKPDQDFLKDYTMQDKAAVFTVAATLKR